MVAWGSSYSTVSEEVSLTKVTFQTRFTLFFHWPVEESLANAVLASDLLICETGPHNAEEAITVYLVVIRKMNVHVSGI